ncbi:geranylgeranyl pyrophosphate synthase [Hyposmocoma kahamanoa]|uniref:geranylgeranyl pyrophosphate synthase n=1 Tax=Hyposmocoma kahamanoa TaxID=1477025 RepID=UPI000E6D8042|nr:geranylgeranyl pyrophosphate synthase [Hyposmocoma kahamanoa]
MTHHLFSTRPPNVEIIYSTLFLLHINDLLLMPGVFGCADDSKVVGSYVSEAKRDSPSDHLEQLGLGLSLSHKIGRYIECLPVTFVQKLGIRMPNLTLIRFRATLVYTEQLLELHRGQGMEIYWRDNFQCPSEEEYREMTIKKTGGLFMLAIRLMQLFSENKSNFSKLSAILGLYFQIRDDYCNLCLQEYSENKSYCEDLTEGKFSFPIIHAIRNQDGDQNQNQVLHILRQRTRDVEVKRYCISLLERLGSFRYTRETLHRLDCEARAEVSRLGGNPHLDALLDELLSWRRDNNHRDLDANTV